MKFLKKRFDENYCEVKMEREKSMEKIKCPRCGKDVVVENVIDYDDYRIVAEDGRVFQYECSECGAFIQVFVNDKQNNQ